MIEDVRNETDLLVAQKKRLTNSLDATEAPLHIANECLANRERRYGEDRVYDAVEVALLKEVEIINNVQNLLRQTIMTAEQQIRANRNAKQNLEMDWSNKWEASVADAKATNRRNEDVDIMFYPGVARHYDK
jgi:tektin-4